MLLTLMILAAPLQIQTHTASENGFLVTSTLVSGEKDAVLFDAQLLNSEAKKVADLVKGKTLQAIYITHGHPDHYFGLSVLQQRFPNARLLAHPEVVKEIEATWRTKHAQWKPMFKDDLADQVPQVTAYDKPSIEIEGKAVQLLAPTQGDTHSSVVANVDGTLIAGDLAYAGVHVWLADTKPAEWDAWLGSLARLQALHPKAVVAGHGAGSKDALAETAAYIKDFRAARATAKNTDELGQVMGKKYPQLKLPVILGISSKAAY